MTVPASEARSSPDLYSYMRSSLIERMAVLAGTTSWREPLAVWTPGAGSDVPWEHVLAMATVWLRENRRDALDVSADILYGIAVMEMPQAAENRCVVALGCALADMSGMCARMSEQAPGLLDACSRTILRKCVTGREWPYPPRATAQVIKYVDDRGARIVWAQATQGLRRAFEALG